ncbi:hypothetical protein SUGI_0798810 [Cryptomeria japonica]|nr:hypothetical protein SUGI_0798810 [Cryptomeria japonica]
MAGYQIALLLLACMLCCAARPFQPSILSPTAKRHNEAGRVQMAVQSGDVVEIKVPHQKIMRMEVELDDVMENFNNRNDDVEDFAKLPKGPVPSSGPSPIINNNSFSIKH